MNGYVELDDTKYGLGIELDESVIENTEWSCKYDHITVFSGIYSLC